MSEKVIAIVMLIKVSIGVSGCMFKKNEPSVEDRQMVRDSTILKTCLLFGDFSVVPKEYDEWRVE